MTLLEPDRLALRALLLGWFDRARRELPWRNTRDPYAIWLSEVMLQQTQVATVIPYWERFLARFPTVTALAEAPLDEVLGLWRGLGYYARARNLHRAARAIVSEHQGALPRSAGELRRLPGFGRYTAGAVASIAFDEPAPLVDGNVARVLCRLFFVEGPPGDRAREATLWRLAEALVVGERPGDFNQALMELGATLCRPEAPACKACPLRARCQAHRTGRTAELPPPRVRAPRKPLELEVGVWTRGQAVLVARRASRGLFGGLWELPSVEPGDELAGAFAQRLGTKVVVGERVGTLRRTLTHRELTLHLRRLSGRGQPSAAHGYEALRFATPTELAKLGVSTAMQRALELVGISAGAKDARSGPRPRRARTPPARTSATGPRRSRSR